MSLHSLRFHLIGAIHASLARRHGEPTRPRKPLRNQTTRFLTPSCLAALLLVSSACNSADDSTGANEDAYSGVIASIEAADAPGAFDVVEREYALEPTAGDGIIQPASGEPSTIVTQIAGRLYLPKTDGPRPL